MFEARHHRPDEGHALGAAERRLGRGLMLTTETLITDLKDKKKQIEGSVR